MEAWRRCGADVRFFRQALDWLGKSVGGWSPAPLGEQPSSDRISRPDALPGYLTAGPKQKRCSKPRRKTWPSLIAGEA